MRLLVGLVVQVLLMVDVLGVDVETIMQHLVIMLTITGCRVLLDTHVETIALHLLHDVIIIALQDECDVVTMRTMGCGVMMVIDTVGYVLLVVGMLLSLLVLVVAV